MSLDYISLCVVYNLVSGVGFTMASNAKRPELKLGGNIVENFKNFEVRFDDYCIQTNYRDITKDPVTEKDAHYKQPILEISALRSALPDEALQVLRYTIEPQISEVDNRGYGWKYYASITRAQLEAH